MGRSPLDHDRWGELGPHLDRALELDPRDLPAWLAQLRAEQPTLAADLEPLLADHTALVRAGFLEDGIPASMPAGGVIGPYRLVRPLGEGGMGIVYLAEQTAPIRREVALKVIKPGMDSKRVIARFEAERQALALMDHPCVSKVFDAGATEDGRPFFVMDYVPGVRITEHCDGRALTTVERLELFLQVCDGVQHAHQKAIIHRDLKPSNVLVSLQDGRAVPKIIDFGVAKATGLSLTTETLYTETGTLIGTPDYMSPEQAGLAAGDVDTRTDVYALGVMAYEMLAGVLPFEPSSLREAGVDGIRRIIREVEPPRPSSRLRQLSAEQSVEVARQRRVDLVALRRQLVGELDWIVMKALEKDRTRRYGSPAELAADIVRYLRHEPVLAGPPSTAYRARKFVQRHRFGTATAVLATLGLIAFMTAIVVQAGRISREAEAKRRVSEVLTGLFEVSDPANARGETMTVRELLDRGAARIRGPLTDDPGLRAELMATMGQVYSNLGLYADAEPMLVEALDTRTRVLGPDDPDTLRSSHEIARLRFRQDRLPEAEELHRQTVDREKRVLGPEDPQTLRTMSDLARVLAFQGRHQESESMARATLEVQRRVLGPDHRDTLSSMVNLAWTCSARGRNDEAEALYRGAFEARKRVLGPEHPDTLAAMTSLAYTVLALGRYAEAEELHRGTVETQRRILGAQHPDTLRSTTALARAYSEERKYEEAEALMRETVEIQRRLLGPEHWETLSSMNSLAIARSGLGRLDEAAALYREILDTNRRVLGAEHPNTLWTMNNLALVWDKQGRYDEALALLQQTFDIRSRVLGREHPETLNSRYNLAIPLVHLRRYAEAESLGRETIEIQGRVLGPKHPKTVRSIYNLACLAAIQHKRAEALRLLRQAVAVGFSNTDLLLRDTDLDVLRDDPEFESIAAATAAAATAAAAAAANRAGS